MTRSLSARARSLGIGLRSVRVLALASVAIAVTMPVGPAAATETCPNAAARSGPSASLPDCRAYEMVTPSAKNSGEVGIEGLGPTGESFDLASSEVLLPNTPYLGGTVSYYRTTRTEQGWSTVSVEPLGTEYESPYRGFDLHEYEKGTSLSGSSTLWATRRRSDPEPQRRVADLYMMPAPEAPLLDIGPLAPPSYPGLIGSEEAGVAEVIEYSDDLSHVLLTDASTFYWPFDETHEGDPSLYEYVGTSNASPLLVGVDDEGKLISKCGTELGGPSNGRQPKPLSESRNNSMSAEGSTVIFTALACGSSPAVNELYARIDNGQPDARTIAISEPTAAACPACDVAAGVRKVPTFVGAAENGSKVFFESEQPLLAGATGKNLYEYDLDAPAGENVTLISGGSASGAANVLGMVEVSRDGSHVYFVAAGVLTGAPNGDGQTATPGAANLYVFDTETKQTQFVAALAGEENELWEEYNPRTKRANEVKAYADATPDGRFLVFGDSLDITPDDTSTVQQVFEYDAQTGGLMRVSIGQEGYNDDGNTDNENLAAGMAHHYASEEDKDGYWSHLSVSEDGTYVFFESSDALTPQAIEDPRGEVKNVYEYHEGNIYLISDGKDVALEAKAGNEGAGKEEETGSSAVHLIGTDPSGRDVFFTTQDSLVPQDTGHEKDLYDARIDGGFPMPVSKPECSGDECQGPLSSAPVLLSPGSEFQAGGGNVKPDAPVSTKKAAAKKKRKVTKKKKEQTKAKLKTKAKAKRRANKSGKSSTKERVR